MAFALVVGTATINKTKAITKTEASMKSFGLSWASYYQSWPDGPNDWPHVTGLCHCGKYTKCGWPFAVRAGHMRYCMSTCTFIHPYPDYPSTATPFDPPVPVRDGDPLTGEDYPAMPIEPEAPIGG